MVGILRNTQVDSRVRLLNKSLPYMIPASGGFLILLNTMTLDFFTFISQRHSFIYENTMPTIHCKLWGDANRAISSAKVELPLFV